LRAGCDDEGVVGEGAAVAKDDFSGVGIKIDGFAEKDLGVFLAAEDGAERRSDLARGKRAGSHLIEKRLEEMEVAFVDEGDGCVGVFEGLRGDESAKTAAEDENSVCAGHSKSTVLVKWGGRDSLQESDLKNQRRHEGTQAKRRRQKRRLAKKADAIKPRGEETSTKRHERTIRRRRIVERTDGEERVAAVAFGLDSTCDASRAAGIDGREIVRERSASCGV